MPKPKPRTVEVEIYDQKYSLVVKSDMAEAEVRTLADFVDERMRQIAAAASTPDSLKIAILTALHLAQEVRDMENYASRSEAIIAKKSDEWTRALEQLLAK